METVKRILQDKISNRIAPGKAVLIFGARRVGKTVMMRQIVDGYPGRTMMLNGEDYDTLALLENRTMANYRHVLEGIDLLAIDEAQNIPQIGSILKLIVDELPGVSVLASGSSSFDLLNKTSRWSAAVCNLYLRHFHSEKSRKWKRLSKPVRISKLA